jgi:hypothetical protein
MTRARQDLGFMPITSIEVGLEGEFEWMRTCENDAIRARN